jgi:hypothetical protein
MKKFSGIAKGVAEALAAAGLLLAATSGPATADDANAAKFRTAAYDTGWG